MRLTTGGGQPKQADCAICSTPIARAVVPSKRDRRKYCSLECRQEGVRRTLRASYRRHRDERIANSRAWQEANPERYLANVRAYQLDHPEQTRATSRRGRLKFRYGLTPEDFERMLDAHGGVCAICQEPEWSRSKNGEIQPLSVDHNHETGHVRGLLCRRCNAVLGWIESPGKLDAALAYLRSDQEHQGKVA